MSMIQIKRELTPAQLKCGLGPACPAIFELTDGSLLLVGKLVAASDIPKDLLGRIAADEKAVVIPRALVSGSLQ